MRFAIYYTPAATSPLTDLASEWLGRNAYGADAPSALPAAAADCGFDTDAWRALTQAPRRYGFHATMKAPFTPADGVNAARLEAALADFCAQTPTVRLAGLKIAQIGSFFALVPAAPSTGLQALAAQSVRHFEPFRAPLSDADLARREASGLTGTQSALLREWGYPYVFDEFRFHMTLTGPVELEHRARVLAALERHFAAHLAPHHDIDALALFAEPERGANFTVHARHPLRSS